MAITDKLQAIADIDLSGSINGVQTLNTSLQQASTFASTLSSQFEQLSRATTEQQKQAVALGEAYQQASVESGKLAEQDADPRILEQKKLLQEYWKLRQELINAQNSLVSSQAQARTQNNNVLWLQKAEQARQDALRIQQEINTVQTKQEKLFQNIKNNPFDYTEFNKARENAAKGIVDPNTKDDPETYTKQELTAALSNIFNTMRASADTIREMQNLLSTLSPSKKYQLDLTTGTETLTAYTSLDPQRFLDALRTAARSAT